MPAPCFVAITLAGMLVSGKPAKDAKAYLFIGPSTCITPVMSAPSEHPHARPEITIGPITTFARETPEEVVRAPCVERSPNPVGSGPSLSRQGRTRSLTAARYIEHQSDAQNWPELITHINDDGSAIDREHHRPTDKACGHMLWMRPSRSVVRKVRPLIVENGHAIMDVEEVAAHGWDAPCAES